MEQGRASRTDRPREARLFFHYDLHIEGNGTYGGGALTVLNSFTNNGLIELTDLNSTYGAGLTVTNGTLTNALGATITSLIGANWPSTRK